MKRLLLLLIFLVGCESQITNPDEPKFDINGKWQSFIFDPTYTFIPVISTLQNNNGNVTGILQVSLLVAPDTYSETKYDVSFGMICKAVNPIDENVLYDISIKANSSTYPGRSLQLDGNIKKVDNDFIIVGHMKLFINGYETQDTYALHFKKQSITYLPKVHDQGFIQ